MLVIACVTVLVLACHVVAQLAPATSQAALVMPDCGPASLSTIARLNGKDVTLQTALSLLPYREQGVSFAELKAAGENLGFAVDALTCPGFMCHSL